MNRQYDEMLNAAIKRLRGRDPGQIAGRAGLKYSPPRLLFSTFGDAVALDANDFHAEPEMEMWHHLTVLQYLDGADGALPGGRWIGMAELPGGMIRGASFDRDIDVMIAAGLSACDEHDITDACLRMGGQIVADGRADLSAAIPFMPRYPLRLNLWLADDEFPASGKVLIDENVSAALGVEAVGTIAAVMVRRLIDALGEG